MAKDWRKQLKSDDPKVRAEAVKKLAASGNQDNLQYLKEIVENDPDPRLQEYARKAARHLYSAHQSTRTASSSQSPPVTEEKSISESDIHAAEGKIQRAYTLHTVGQTKKAIPIFIQALELNPDLGKDPFTRSVATELTGLSYDQAIKMLKDPSKHKDIQTVEQGIVEKSSVEPDHTQGDRSGSNLVQSWLSFFNMTEDFFRKEMRKANNEDTFLSILVFTIAAVLIFLVNGFFQIQQITQVLGDQLSSLDLNLGMLFFYLLLGTVIITPLSFYLSVGLQFLGVRLFGGKGNFKSHAYLLALIQVPTTIMGGVVSLAAFIPIIGFLAGLAGLGLSIYGIILTVRAVKAVHNLSTGQAIGGMIVPPLILMAIGSCILMTLGSALGALFNQIQ
ncbi:MAG: YIP1 family protein [Anaerolineales bacterium]|nr:YIP1 family protein [Anaerolineales bacterium]